MFLNFYSSKLILLHLSLAYVYSIRKVLLFGVIFSLGFLGNVQGQTFFETVEIRHNLPKKWQIRFRPLVFPLPAPLEFPFPRPGFRTEIMVGKTLNAHWKVFSYSMLDFYKSKHQSGIRVDYSNTYLDKKLYVQGQLRTFVGLSKDTKFEGIFIGDIHYRVQPKLALGLRNFTLQSPEESQFLKVRRSFVGPAAWWYPSPKSSFLTYYGPNIMKKDSYLFMLVWFVTI